MTADEKFLSRWSRLKKEVRQTEEKPPEPEAEASQPPAAAPVVSAKESPAATAAAAPQLPPIDTLKGLASDYTEFLKPGVDDSLRRSALKKLFSDPYFETFEKFEAYCEDYTQGEPIPPAMLKTLEHAKGLLFDEEKKEEKSAVAEKPTALPKPDQTPQPQASAKIESSAAPVAPDDKA